METEQITEALWLGILEYGPGLLLALVTLVFGLMVINKLGKWFVAIMEKRNIDPSLKGFLKSFLTIVLKVLLAISIAAMVGVETTSFIAVIGAAGLAIGFALQGSLANFAGGILILLLKPFRAGHFIEAQGVMGTVREIQVFHTVLNTPDNKTLIIPNGNLANSLVTNFSLEEKRRVDMVFGIGYGDDLLKAKNILLQLLEEDERVLDDPQPMVAVKELGNSSVDFNVRGWCKAADYWSLYWDMHEKVKLTFDKEGVTIPFPQRDVHMYNKS